MVGKIVMVITIGWMGMSTMLMGLIPSYAPQIGSGHRYVGYPSDFLRGWEQERNFSERYCDALLNMLPVKRRDWFHLLLVWF